VKPDSRPKKNTHCLHIAITEGRTYNIVGFDKDSLDEWIKVLKLAIKIYQFKKMLKKWVKENADIKTANDKDVPNDDDTSETQKRKEKKRVLINFGDDEDPVDQKETKKPDSPRKASKTHSPRKASKVDSPRKASSTTASTESQVTPNVEASSQHSDKSESNIKGQSKSDREESKSLSSYDEKKSEKVTKPRSESDLKSNSAPKLKFEDEVFTIKQLKRRFRNMDDEKADQILKQLLDALYKSNQIRECFLHFIHLEEELGHTAKEFMVGHGKR